MHCCLDGATVQTTKAKTIAPCSLNWPFAAALCALVLTALLSAVPSTAFAISSSADPDASTDLMELTPTTQTFDPLQDPDYVDSSAPSSRPAFFGLGALELTEDLQQQALERVKSAVSAYNQVTYTLGGVSQTHYGVRLDDLALTINDLAPILQQVWDDPEFFYFPSTVTHLTNSSGVVVYLSYEYPFESTEEIDRARAQVEENVALALTWVAEDMSAVQKVQALHDYLVRTCAYGDPDDAHSHTAYGALVQRTPVCQGYALAYKLLLSRLGIGCIFVSSDEMIHGWNMVQLDGAWYHVDVTWDDPSVGNEEEGYHDQGFDAEVSHRCFLKSDATFQNQLEHFGWVSNVEAPQDYPVYDYPVYDGPADVCLSGHSWGKWTLDSKPSCEQPGTETRTCSAGEQTQTRDVSALGHLWATEATVDVEPTCTQAGETSVHCTRCAARKDVTPVSVKDHSWGNWSLTVQPSCEELGSKTRTCSACGQAQTQDVPAVGHAWEDHATIDDQPTYDAAGSQSVHCARCEAVKDAQSIAALPKTSLSKCAVTLSATSYIYSGTTKKPAVTVKMDGRVLSSSFYTVSYSSGCKLVGTYTVTVKAKSGNVPIQGSAKLTFTIKPRTTYVTSLSADKAGFTARWNKRVSQTSGYQVQYRLKGSSATKTVTVSGASTTAKKITKLKAKKRYYVKIRTYKTVSGKRYYSSWSSAKSVVTR